MKLTKLEKSWALYDWANSAYTMTVTTAVFPLYFKAIAAESGISGAQSTVIWANINGYTSLLVAFLAPILGTIADYYGFKKRFFMFFLAMGISACLLLGFIPESQWVLLLLVYMISALGFSGGNIFYDAFLVDVTNDERMDKVSTRGYALGYIGSTIPFIICMAIILLSSNGILPFDDYTAPKITFVITAVWWLAFSFPMVKTVKQVHGIEREPQFIKKSFIRLKNTFSEITHYRAAFIFLLAYFFYIDGVDTIIRMASSYGADLGIDANSLLIILLVTQFVAFPSAIAFGHFAGKYKGKVMLYVAIVGYIIISIFAYFMKDVTDFWVLALLVGLFQGGIQALSRSYFAKLIPKENANKYFGLYNIFGKFAAIMGPFLMAFAISITGESRYGVLSLIVLFVCGGLLLLNVRPNKDATGELDN